MDLEGWSWGQLSRDNYVGYVRSNELGNFTASATHRVNVPGTYLFREPDLKSPPIAAISLNAGPIAGYRGTKQIPAGGTRRLYIPGSHFGSAEF